MFNYFTDIQQEFRKEGLASTFKHSFVKDLIYEHKYLLLNMYALHRYTGTWTLAAEQKISQVNNRLKWSQVSI
jgi:hypothetical protein